MPIEPPQNAPKNKENAVSKEGEQQHRHQEQVVHSKVEEAPKSKTRARQRAKIVMKAADAVQSEAVPTAEENEEQEARLPSAERRVAPEYTIVLTDAFWEATYHRKAEYIEAVKNEANARMYKAEAMLCNVDEIITIGRVGPIATFDQWWTAFLVEDQWFILRYREEEIREYELLPAFGPSPGDGGPAPTQKRLQKRPPPKRIAPRPRTRRDQGDAKGVRGVVTSAPPKRRNAKKEAKRIATDLVQRAAWELSVLCNTFGHSWEQSARAITPHLLRSVVKMRRRVTTISHLMCDARSSFVQLAQQTAAFITSEHGSLSSFRPHTHTISGQEARLEPRLACPNTGLTLVLSSWVRTDLSPIDWSQPRFVVDWNANLFGVKEEQAFT